MELLAPQAKISLPPKLVIIKVEFRKKTIRKQNEIWTEGQPGVCKAWGRWIQAEGGVVSWNCHRLSDIPSHETWILYPFLSVYPVPVEEVLRDANLNIQLNTITDFSPPLPIQWIWNQQQLIHSLTAMEIKTCMGSGGSATSVYSSTYPSSSCRRNLPKSPSMSQKLSSLRKHPYVY